MTQYNTSYVKVSNSQHNKLKSGIENGTEVTLNFPSNIGGSSNDDTNFLNKLFLTNTQVLWLHKTFASGSSCDIKSSKAKFSKRIQLGGVLTHDPISGNFGPRLLIWMLNSIAKEWDNMNPKDKNESKNKGIGDFAVDTGLNIVGKKGILTLESLWITVTNNEIKDIVKVINSLENRGISFKLLWIISQEGRFLNFLKPLMRTALPLMKNVLTPLAKSVFAPLGLTASASTTNIAIQKKNFGLGTTTLIISNEEMDVIKKIAK